MGLAPLLPPSFSPASSSPPFRNKTRADTARPPTWQGNCWAVTDRDLGPRSITLHFACVPSEIYKPGAYSTAAEVAALDAALSNLPLCIGHYYRLWRSYYDNATLDAASALESFNSRAHAFIHDSKVSFNPGPGSAAVAVA